MARKPILEGGKREEILACATRLFLKNGYEGTSIRMILEDVGGEVGMFYHYFNSKKELFDKVFEKFMKEQGNKITQSLSDDLTSEIPFLKLKQTILCYRQSMEEYQKLANGTIHWSMLAALHEFTVSSMLPAVKEMIVRLYERYKTNNLTEIDWITPYLLKGISGLLHDKNFSILPLPQQLQYIIELICRTLVISPAVFKEKSYSEEDHI